MILIKSYVSQTYLPQWVFVISFLEGGDHILLGSELSTYSRVYKSTSIYLKKERSSAVAWISSPVVLSVLLHVLFEKGILKWYFGPFGFSFHIPLPLLTPMALTHSTHVREAFFNKQDSCQQAQIDTIKGISKSLSKASGFNSTRLWRTFFVGDTIAPMLVKWRHFLPSRVCVLRGTDIRRQRANQ